MALAPASITLQNVAAANVVYNLRERESGYARYHQVGVSPAQAQRVAIIHKPAKSFAMDDFVTDSVLVTKPNFDIDGNAVRLSSARADIQCTNRMTQSEKEEFYKAFIQAVSLAIFKDQVEDGEALV